MVHIIGIAIAMLIIIACLTFRFIVWILSLVLPLVIAGAVLGTYYIGIGLIALVKWIYRVVMRFVYRARYKRAHRRVAA